MYFRSVVYWLWEVLALKQQEMTERERKALELWQTFKAMCESEGFEVKTHGCYELFMIDKQQNELIYLDSFTDVTE